MSAMSTLATELELYWQYVGDWANSDYWQRPMPDGQLATLVQRAWGGWSLIIENLHTQRYDTLAAALVAAGQIAREQLADQARTWAA